MNNTQLYFGFADVRSQNAFLSAVYRWMFAGLAASAASAFLVASNPALRNLVFGGSFNFLFIAFAEVALVFYLSANIRTMSVSAARLAFVAYAVINGATFSYIFAIYKLNSIVQIFVASACVFGAAGIFGARSKKNLASTARYAFMGLYGLIFASIFSLIFRSQALDFVATVAGVAVFVVLAACDTQKVLATGSRATDSDDYKKVAVLAALELYLDFINIFIRLLRLFGKRRD